MAIMAILATVMVPNVLRSIERAAVRAEAETVSNLGEQAMLYLRDTAAPPTSANWNTVLGTYASLSPADILTNRRQMQRVYVPDPVAANQRALLISSMRNGAPLPSVAIVQANFAGIWNWVYNSVTNQRPPGFAAASWPPEITDTFLVIERVNFAQVYRTDLASYTVILQNQSVAPTSRTVSFRVLNPDGTTKSQGPMAPKPAATWQQTITLGAKERLNLYTGAAYAGLDYTYVGVSSEKTFDCSDAIGWRAQ